MCSLSANPPWPQAGEAALWSAEGPPDYQSVPSPRQSRRDLLSCSGLPRLAGENPRHLVTPRLRFSGLGCRGRGQIGSGRLINLDDDLSKLFGSGKSAQGVYRHLY